MIEDVGYLHLHRENRKFRLENQMVSSFPFGNLQKIWAVICRDAIFLLLLACSADFDILRSGSFTHHVKFLSRKGSRGGIIVVARSYMLFLIFFSGNFYFSFVSTSVAYIAIPRNKGKIKTSTADKKLTRHMYGKVRTYS